MKYILLIFFFLLSFSTYSSDSTVQTGNWETSSTWGKNIEPTTEDTLIIESNDTITISSNLSYNTQVVIILKGTLIFQGKLNLTSGSEIISEGGLITSINGGNSNKITIGNTGVWSGADGDLDGYFTVDGNGVLPVIWLSYYANISNNIISVYWSTLKEDNNDFYTIEYSKDFSDWEVKGYINGNGNTNKLNEYKLSFQVYESGYYYIRIKQTDINGESQYSDIISVYSTDDSVVFYYMDYNGRKFENKPKGFSIAIYKNGEKKKMFLD